MGIQRGKKSAAAALGGLFLALFALLPALARAAEDSLQVQSFKTHSRLVIRLDDSVTFSKRNSAEGFEIDLKGVALSDLGVPLGDEDHWKSQFSQVSDPRLASLGFTEYPGGLKIAGRWKFPKGEAALAHPEMELFDYRERTPGQLVLDFWVKKGPTVLDVKAARAQAEKIAAMKRAEQEAKRRAERRIASEKLKAESEDVTKFCRQPISERNDVFLPFLPVHEPVNFSQWFSSTTPDSQFPYYVPMTKTKDAQYVRLALELYRQGKPGLVIRTLDFFEKEQPNSSFRHEMRFLRANALIKLGMQDEAERLLSRLPADAKDTPEALHAAMYLAGKLVEKKNHLAALETFMWLSSHHSDHRLNWVFHLGAAEALYALRQTDRASKEYQWVIENGPDQPSKAMAALRMGDLYMERFQYEQALATYFQGLHHFADQAVEFPAVHINRAEALYWLGQYDRAKESFQKFLDSYPAHPAGWRAAFRLGEIEARQAPIASEGAGAAEKESSAAKWFYETINRFPVSPGATLARLRLIPCGDHGGFTAASAERFFTEEAARFDGRGEVAVARYADFRALARVRSLITLSGDGDKTVTAAFEELQNAAHKDVRILLSDILGALFRKSVLSLLDEGKKYDALAFYRDKVKLIPRESDEIEPDYLLKLSQAASDLGLAKVASELAAAYTDRLSHLKDRGIASAPVGGEPDLEDKLRLAERSFTEAKAVWVGGGERAKVRELLSKVTEESPYSFEREVILGLLDEKEGKPANALAHAVKAQLLAPMKGPNPRLEAWLAGLMARTGDPKVALDLYRGLENFLNGPGAKAKPSSAAEACAVLGLAPVPSADTVILAQAGILEKLGKWGEAAAQYQRAVDKGHGGNEMIYEYARALLKTGEKSDHAKAVAALEKVASSKDEDFWKKLARETLVNLTKKTGN